MEDLEFLARRFVMATDEIQAFQQATSSSSQLTNARRELVLDGANVKVIIITQPAASVSQNGMTFLSPDVSIFLKIQKQLLLTK